jgi:MFS family permease
VGRAGTKRGWGGRDFRLLVASTGLSSLGDELALIALTIKVAELTDSGWAVAALLLAGLLPLVIFAPAAGVIVDNFETRRSLIIASAIQAGLAVWLAFAGGLPGILLLSFLLGTCTAVASPAIYTLAPTIVGEQHSTEGNAYLETARYIGMIAGPVMAGTLSAGPGTKIALLVDAGTFAVIALAAAALTVRRKPAPSEEGAGEAKAGFGVVRRDRMLVIGFALVAFIVLFAAMDNVAEIFFASDSLHAGAWGYGVLASVWIVGMVVGSSQIARRLRPSGLMPAMALAAVVGGAAVAVAGAVAVMAVAVVMFVIGGVANGVITVSMRSIIVHRVPDRYRGRVFAAYGGLFFGTQLAAMAVAGGLVVALGGRTVLIIGGLGTIVAGVAGLLAYRSLPAAIRAMPGDETEDADEVGGPESLTTQILSSDEVVPEAVIAQAFEGSEPAAQVDGSVQTPERPDVTRIPESDPLTERVAER